MEQDADQAILISLDQGLEGPRDVARTWTISRTSGSRASSCCSRTLESSGSPERPPAADDAVFHTRSSVAIKTIRPAGLRGHLALAPAGEIVAAVGQDGDEAGRRPASMARPLVLRTVALTPRSRRTATNRSTASGSRPDEGQTRHWIVRDQVDTALAGLGSRAPTA